MEEIRKVANACYKAGANNIKQLTHDFFNSMDQNGNGKVILCEYLAFMEKWGYTRMSNEEWFRKLDKAGRGNLDLHDVMTLCYIVKSRRPCCLGCGEFISGVFFTCVKCFDDSCFDHSVNFFSVCLQCYESKNFVDDGKEFLDNFTLLEAWRWESQLPVLRAPAAEVQTRKASHPQASKEMEELRQIAMAHCRSTSEGTKEKEKIDKFINSMGHGKHVALGEFVEFMRQKACKHFMKRKLDLEFMDTPGFFNELARDEEGLGESDVKALYYIIQSGRPFCKGCGKFITGMFLTCVSCFLRGRTCFSLCLHCYKAKKFDHGPCTDRSDPLFLDNYTLLETMRGTPRNRSKLKNLLKALRRSTSSPGPINKPNTSSPGSRVRVPQPAPNAEDTIEGLELALNMVVAAVSAVPALAAVCVIL